MLYRAGSVITSGPSREFRVAADGEMMLIGLRGTDLTALTAAK
jgi:hypothetical protein